MILVKVHDKSRLLLTYTLGVGGLSLSLGNVGCGMGGGMGGGDLSERILQLLTP